MAKKILIVFLALTILFSFPFVVFADSVQSPISRPIISDYDAYFCTPSFLILFTCMFPQEYTEGRYDSNNEWIDVNSILNITYFASLNTANNTIMFSAYSGNVGTGFPVVVSVFNIKTGAFVSHDIGSSGNTTTLGSSLISWAKPSAYDIQNISIADGCLDNIPRLSVSWAEDNTYQTDFDTVNNNLVNLRNLLNNIYNQDSNYYNTVIQFLTDFYAPDEYDGSNHSFNDLFLHVRNIDDWTYTICNDFETWISYSWTPYKNQVLIYLLEIKNLIQGDQNSPQYTSPAVSEYSDSVSNYIEEEDQYMVDVSPGIENQVSNVIGNYGGFSKAGEALQFFKVAIDDLIISNSSLYSLIVTVLLFGVAVLILGRRFSF